MVLPLTTSDVAPSIDPRLMGIPGEEKAARLYRKMYFIRRFEETLLALFEEGILNGTTHACIGQEANSVAIMEHLERPDHVFSNHRCHGHYLARYGDALGLLAEIMGKRAGICGGVGGSQHIAADGFKSNGIQGGIVPAATGIALACRLKGEGAVSVVFLGDGTLGEGAVYESLNIASLWKLPILFVLENNLWSQSTPIHLNLAGDIAARFEAFGIATISVKSTDVLELDLLAHRALREVRETSTPRALIIETYRLCHHSKNDDSRPASEVEAHRVNEPLLIHGPRLDGAVKRSIEHGVEQALEEVVTIARGLT